MAVNKNFVIRNGLEVDTDLIIANSQSNRVGIGTSIPLYNLHVKGGIGVTESYVTGVSTVCDKFDVGIGGTVLTVLGVGGSIGIAITLPQYILDIRSPVSTGITALYAQGDARITGRFNAGNIDTNNLYISGFSTFTEESIFGSGIVVSGVSTFNSSIFVSNYSVFNDNVLISGIGTVTKLVSTSGTITNLTGTAATIGNVKVSSGIITATSGIVTYYGDGQYLNLSNSPYMGIGIGTTGGVVGYGITFLSLKGAGVSTTFYNSNTGIATIFFEGGGGSGIITSTNNLQFSAGSAVSPSLFFSNDIQTGFFSPSTGQFTVVSSGSSILNINSSGINVSGIVTSNGANFKSNDVSEVVLKNYAEKVQVIGNTGITTTFDLKNANVFTATLTGNCTFTFVTGVTSGAASFTLVLTNDSTANRIITWPVSVKWSNNVVPIRTTDANKTDIWSFFTADNGNIWYGGISLLNFT